MTPPPEAAVFLLTAFGSIALVFAAATLTGRAALAQFDIRSGAERMALSGALGLGLFGTVFYLAGLARLFDPVTAVTVLALGTWLGFRRGASTASFPREALAIALLALPLLILSLYPPTAWDATMYHLPLARATARYHGVPWRPEIRHSFFPQLQETLFALPLLFSSPGLRATPAAISVIMMALVALLLFDLGCRARGTRTGLWAALLWMSSPLAIDLGTSALVEMGVALFATAAVAAYLRWREDGAVRWLALAGALSGFAAATKYSGLSSVAVVGISIVVSRKRSLRGLAAFCASAAAVLGPWYARTWILTGNPLYGFAGSLFGVGHGPYSPSELVWYRAQYPGLLTALSSNAPALLASRAAGLLAHLLGLSLPIPTAVLIAVVGALAVVAATNRLARAILALAAAQGILLFRGFEGARFLFSIVPLLFLLAGVALSRLVELLPPRFSRIISAVGSIWLAAPGLCLALSLLAQRGPLPTSVAAGDKYLEPIAGYAAIEELNHREGNRAVAYGLCTERLVYYADGALVGDWIGPWRFSRVASRLGSPSELARELNAMGARYLLLRKHFLPPLAPTSWKEPPGFDVKFEKVFEDSVAVLYELR
jgi:hypothetical protein